MSNELTKTQKNALNRASAVAVTSATGELLRRFLPNNRWVAARNRYRTQILQRLTTDWPSGHDSRELTHYLAASSFHHGADGWSFFGRALNAHLAGDGDAARHLGYYAELRGSLGILATQGIGVFNSIHVVAEAGGNVRLFKGPGTHVMSWLALPYWAKTQSAAATLARLVAPSGVPLDRWTDVLPSAGSWRPVAEEWLRTWGLDLRLLALDRDARNESSYQPSRIAGRRSIDARAAAEFAVEVWALLEPAGGDDPFPLLDQQLLRRGLEAAFLGAGGKLSTVVSSAWGSAVTTAVEEAVGDPAPPGLRDFLLRRDSATRQDSTIFAHADRSLPISDPEHHLGVLSRALLLLRVCSGCIADTCSAAGVSAADVAFWMGALAQDRGLWATPPLPEPLTDLYADVEVAMQDLRALMNETPPISSYHDLRTRAASALLALAGCERVAAWSTAA